MGLLNVLGKIIVPGAGLVGDLFDTAAGVTDRLENSATSAGVLGMLGPTAFLADKDLAEKIATGKGESPVDVPRVLGPVFEKAADISNRVDNSLSAAGVLGAGGPISLVKEKETILKAVATGDRPDYNYGKALIEEE